MPERRPSTGHPITRFIGLHAHGPPDAQETRQHGNRQDNQGQPLQTGFGNDYTVGEMGKKPLPNEIGNRVAQDPQRDGLLKDQARNHTFRRTDELQQSDRVESVERQRTENQGHHDGRNDS